MKKLAISMAFVLSVLAISPANAHTTLVTASPAKNAVITTSPKSIVLTFDDPLIKLSGKNLSWIHLYDSKNKSIKLPVAIVNKTVISVSLPTLAANKYRVSYRVVSNDGHPVSGNYFFTVK